MKKMVLNEDAFTRCFRTAKGSRLGFFFRFWGHRQPEKGESGSISLKHGTEGLHGKNIWSVPTFLWVRTHFFCSVNGAEEYCTGQVS